MEINILAFIAIFLLPIFHTALLLIVDVKQASQNQS